MKNIYIGKIEDYFEMRLFILGVVNDVLDPDKDYCRIDFNNSNLSLVFTDFVITDDIVISIRVINKERIFHADDFKRFESLNSSIMSYGINEPLNSA
jgi:hypothetical protein